jgi:hypothetical protein
MERKETEERTGKTAPHMVKIWWPDKEGFQYIEACFKNCGKKDKCIALSDYLEPKLFS